MDFIFRWAEEFLKKHKRIARYRRVFAVLAAVVVFATTYELILPAITMDRQKAAATPGVEVGVAAESAIEEAENADGEEVRSAPKNADGQEEEAAAEAEAGEEKEAAPAATDDDNSGDAAKQDTEEKKSEDKLAGSDSGDKDTAEEDEDDSNAGQSAPKAAASSASEEDAEDGSTTAKKDEKTAVEGEEEKAGTASKTKSGDKEADQDAADTTAADASSRTGSTAAATDPSQTAVTAAVDEDGNLVYPANLLFEGKDYTVTAAFDETAALPADVRLDITEILPDTLYTNEDDIPVYADYNEYYDKTLKTLEKANRLDDQNIASARFFDISFQDADGRAVEPAAPVSISVKYKDALSAEDTADTVAIHFDDVKIEDRDDIDVPEIGKAKVIETMTDVRKEEIESITFEAETFSVYAIVGTAPGTPVNMTVGTTETITPDYPNGVTSAKYQSYTWTSGDASVASIQSGNNKSEAVIKANKAGTATVTLDYKYGKKEKDVTIGKAVFAVTVTEAEDPDPGSGDTSDSAFTEEEATAQEGTLADVASGDMTVTVKETGRLKKLSDYHVVVKDASDAYADDADMLKAYHIYLADESGKEVTDLEKDLKNSQNLSLRVTITYDEEQDWFDQAKDIKHYKNGEEQTINGVTFGKDKKTISFNVRGFSDFVIQSESTSQTSEGQPVTTEKGSILDGNVSYNDANEWQIVSGHYRNNNVSSKTPSSDGFVRVQKNIIPTGVENEFYVYLSVDKKEEVTTQQFSTYISDKSHYVIGSASHFPDIEVNGQTRRAVAGELCNLQGQEKGGVTENKNTSKNKNYHITVKYNGVVLGVVDFYADCSNSCVYFKLRSTATHNDVAYIAMYAFKDESNITVDLSKEAYERLVDEVITYSTKTSTTLNYVADEMGDYITYLGDIRKDPGSTVSGAVVGENSQVLRWNIVEKTSPIARTTSATGSTSTWYINTAELAYKVRLDVTKEQFNSCAENLNSTVSDSVSYEVNKGAKVNYKISTASTPSETFFPVPYVRGLLYDVTGQKVDQDNNPIKNASLEFTLSGEGVDGSNVTGIATETDGSGYFTIPGVQAAKSSYTLTETKAPSGYAKKTDPKAVNLNYTNATYKNVFEAVSGTGHMKLKDDKTTLVFVNEFTVVNLKLTKKGTDTGKPLLGNASFKLEKMKKEENDLVVDSSWGPLSGTTGSAGELKGILKWESTSEKPISPGFYQITETAAPSGYILNSDAVIIQVDNNKSVSIYGGTGAGAYEIGDSVREGSGSDAKVFATITATDDPIRIAVKKVGASGTSSDYTAIGGVGFTLTDTSGTSFSGTTIQTAGNDQGYIFWEKVPAGTYTLTEDETTVPAGYKPSLSATVVIKDDGTVESVTPVADSTKPEATDEIIKAGTKVVDLEGGKTATYQTIQVVNRKSEVCVIIRKTDSNGDTTSAGATTATKFLAGAQFTIYDEADQPVEAMNTLLNAQSDEFGYVTKSLIDPDSGEVTETTTLPMEIGKTYYLEENKAPDGYNLPEGKYKLVVGDVGISIYNYSKSEGGYSSAPSKNYSIEEGVCTVMIQNTAGEELPHTGGTGFLSPQTLIGIMAMAFVLAAGVMYSFSERREERRSMQS